MPRRAAVLLASLVCLLVTAPAVYADQSVSSNWAGYAAHRSGVHFRAVQGAWRQPKVRCTSPDETYSAMWVGLGGYSQTSAALEQIGTEVDCNKNGGAVSSAWFELVPAPSMPISMTVRSGDAMSASVTLGARRRVTLALSDLTRHESFRRTFVPAKVDDTSAEWILEAPSACFSQSSCQTLPLADFGAAAFGLAAARTTAGHTQPISSRQWATTQITLAPSSTHRFARLGYGSSAGGAMPSALAGGGSAFAVTFDGTGAPPAYPSYGVRRSSDGPTYLRH